MSGTLLLESPDRVIARAWADEDFKSALLADPRSALRSQGFEIPAGMTLNVLEDTESVTNLVLPRVPDMGLCEEALDGSGEAARCGGGCHCGGGCGGGCACGGACLCQCL
jgi:hypothetical protein